MEKIDIYWFSGSGNTLLLALELKQYLMRRGIKVRLLPIEKFDPKSIDHDAVIGIVIPVAAQGTYTLVWDFIEALPCANDTGAFLLDSLGMYSGGIVGPVKKILKKKGFQTLAAKEIIMPNIFYKKKSFPEKEALQIKNGIEAVHIFAETLLAGKGGWRDIPFYSTFLSLISRSKKVNSWYRKLIPVSFDDNKCTRCGLCVKLCPVANLSRTGDDAPFATGNSCIHCQRCYAFCPTQAISIGNKKNLAYKALTAKEFLKQLDLK